MSFDRRSVSQPALLATGMTLCGILALSACDAEDPYEEAPSATATAASESSSSPSADDRKEQTKGQSAGLPPGHPPVESSGSNQAENPGAAAQQGGGSKQAKGTGAARKQTPLTWSLPSSWKSVQPSTRMRLAEYRVPGTANTNPASLGVFHFGRRGGGDVQANIDRWKKQFTASNGGKPTAEVKVRNPDDGTLTVHTVDISGTYEPGVGMGGGQAQKGQRMLAAIVESPDGLYFFKMIGPEATVSNATDGFKTLIESLDYSGY